MGSMRTPTRSRLIRLGLAALLAGAFTATSGAAGPIDWPGACYCRGGGTRLSNRSRTLVSTGALQTGLL